MLKTILAVILMVIVIFLLAPLLGKRGSVDDEI